MDFTQVDNPFDPWPSGDAVERQIAECAARPGGHAWTIQGDAEERPWLACDDCPAGGDDLYPDIIDLLDGQTYELGGRTIVIGKELPDDETSMFKIPVHVSVEEHSWTSMNSIGPEYDVEIQISDRETAA